MSNTALITCVAISFLIYCPSVGYCLFDARAFQSLRSDKLTTPHFLFYNHPRFGVGWGIFIISMIHLIYENGGFRSERPFENRHVETEDVTLTVKDVVPDSKQKELALRACEFINQQIKTDYVTDGVGGVAELKEISVITKFNFRLYKI